MAFINDAFRVYRGFLELFNKFRLLLINALLKLNLSQDIVFIFMASLVGIASGYGAVLFHEAIRLVQELLFVQMHSTYQHWPWSKCLVLFYPAIGGLFVGLMNVYVSPESRGHGVPDVIKAVVARGGYMRSSAWDRWWRERCMPRSRPSGSSSISRTPTRLSRRSCSRQ